MLKNRSEHVDYEEALDVVSLPEGVAKRQNSDPFDLLKTPWLQWFFCLFILIIIIILRLEREEEMFTMSVVKPKQK